MWLQISGDVVYYTSSNTTLHYYYTTHFLTTDKTDTSLEAKNDGKNKSFAFFSIIEPFYLVVVP